MNDKASKLLQDIFDEQVKTELNEKFVKDDIVINLGTSKETIEAMVEGGFAYHETLSKIKDRKMGNSVTHIKTGISLASNLSIVSCKKLIKEVKDFPEWNDIKGQNVPPELMKKLKDILPKYMKEKKKFMSRLSNKHKKQLNKK